MTGPASDKLHLGCGENYRERWHNVDAVEAVSPDEVVDLNETPWPWPDGSFLRIDAEHVIEHLDDTEAVLRECARVLRPHGRLHVTVPMGLNAIADPDHTTVWTWQTPEFYCGARHWDVDVGLSVVDRSVSMHSLYHDVPSQAVSTAVWQVRKAIQGAGEWCFNQPAMSGEFTVVFEYDG